MSWECLADAIHKRTTRCAEEVGHFLAGTDCPRLAVGREILAAAYMSQMRVCNYEIGGEHRGGDFATVCTVAEECVNQARTFGWLLFAVNFSEVWILVLSYVLHSRKQVVWRRSSM